MTIGEYFRADDHRCLSEGGILLMQTAGDEWLMNERSVSDSRRLLSTLLFTALWKYDEYGVQTSSEYRLHVGFCRVEEVECTVYSVGCRVDGRFIS